MSAARKSMLLMVAFVALWAGTEALASTVSGHYSPYQVVWTRYAVHLALMLVVWGWREPASLWRTKRPWFQSARSLLMLGMPASWALATQVGVVPGTLMAIFWMSPLLILAFGRLFLRERAAPSVWLVSGVACVGALLLTRPGPLPPPHLLVFPLAMAVTFSLYVVMTRSLRSETTRANLFYTALGVFAVLTPWMPQLWLTPSAHDLAVMTGVGLLGYLTLWALDRLAAAAPVSVAAPLAYLQLAFTLALAAGMGRHGLGPAAAAGLLIIVGVAICVWARAPRQTVREAV